jgi:hypothetical protein
MKEVANLTRRGEVGKAMEVLRKQEALHEHKDDYPRGLLKPGWPCLPSSASGPIFTPQGALARDPQQAGSGWAARRGAADRANDQSSGYRHSPRHTGGVTLSPDLSHRADPHGDPPQCGVGTGTRDLCCGRAWQGR